MMSRNEQNNNQNSNHSESSSPQFLHALRSDDNGRGQFFLDMTDDPVDLGDDYNALEVDYEKHEESDDDQPDDPANETMSDDELKAIFLPRDNNHAATTVQKESGSAAAARSLQEIDCETDNPDDDDSSELTAKVKFALPDEDYRAAASQTLERGIGNFNTLEEHLKILGAESVIAPIKNGIITQDGIRTKNGRLAKNYRTVPIAINAIFEISEQNYKKLFIKYHTDNVVRFYPKKADAAKEMREIIEKCFNAIKDSIGSAEIEHIIRHEIWDRSAYSITRPLSEGKSDLIIEMLKKNILAGESISLEEHHIIYQSEADNATILHCAIEMCHLQNTFAFNKFNPEEFANLQDVIIENENYFFGNDHEDRKALYYDILSCGKKNDAYKQALLPVTRVQLLKDFLSQKKLDNLGLATKLPLNIVEEILISARHLVHSRDRWGKTPAHWAVERLEKNPEIPQHFMLSIIATLAKHGANPLAISTIGAASLLMTLFGSENRKAVTNAFHKHTNSLALKELLQRTEKESISENTLDNAIEMEEEDYVGRCCYRNVLFMLTPLPIVPEHMHGKIININFFRELSMAKVTVKEREELFNQYLLYLKKVVDNNPAVLVFERKKGTFLDEVIERINSVANVHAAGSALPAASSDKSIEVDLTAKKEKRPDFFCSVVKGSYLPDQALELKNHQRIAPE